ncbi:MAG: conjugal transfer protein TraX [Bacilli bacterium]|jgi:hypothetical protein|nr:conjugal transfer protein TraX [Bacilli bacterium]
MTQNRYRSQNLSEFWLKIIALVAMSFDHIGVFLNDYSGSFANSGAVSTTALVFRIVGRLAFPLFAFMLAEGLRHTHDKGKYLMRLFDVFALIFVVELVLYVLNLNGIGNFGVPSSQIFTSLVLYALFACLVERKDWMRWLTALPVAYILLSYAADICTLYYANATAESVRFALSWQNYFPLFVRAQYSLFGFLVFLGFYYARPFADRFVKKSLSLDEKGLAEYQATSDYQRLLNIAGATSLSVVTIIFWGLSYIATEAAPYTFDVYKMGLQTYGLLSALLILCYNGKRGYDSKWFRAFNYLYYPVHIAIIALVFALVFN